MLKTSQDQTAGIKGSCHKGSVGHFHNCNSCPWHLNQENATGPPVLLLSEQPIPGTVLFIPFHCISFHSICKIYASIAGSGLAITLLLLHVDQINVCRARNQTKPQAEAFSCETMPHLLSFDSSKNTP